MIDTDNNSIDMFLKAFVTTQNYSNRHETEFDYIS